MFATIDSILKKIRREKPLVLNLTNYVTMDFVANGLLCLGASPVMSVAPEEIEDLVYLSRAIVINPGTLDDAFIARSQYACTIASQLKKPILLDPVGAGASLYRTDAYQTLLNHAPISIVRGNASEIMALADLAITTQGVDSASETDDAIISAHLLSQRYHATIIVSGKTDIVVDGDHIARYSRGSALMPMITGTGCLLSAVIATFHAVENRRFEAACAATLFYSICGEIAEEKAAGPGTFKAHFLDALGISVEENYYATH